MAIKDVETLTEELCKGLIPHVYVDGSYINPKQIVDIDTTEYKGKEVPEFTLADGTVVAHNRFEAGDIGHYLDEALTKLRGPVGEGADFKPPFNRLINSGNVWNQNGEQIATFENVDPYFDNHIDVENGYIFGARAYDGELWRADLDGTGEVQLASVTQILAFGLDRKNQRVYYAWKDSNDAKNIDYVSYDGSSTGSVLASIGTNPQKLLVADDWLFYSNGVEDIYKAAKDGSSNNQIASLYSDVSYLELGTIDKTREELYFFSENGEYHGRCLDYDGNVLRKMGADNADPDIEGIAYSAEQDALIAIEGGGFGDDFEDRIIEMPRDGRTDVLRVYGNDQTDKWNQERIDISFDNQWR